MNEWNAVIDDSGIAHLMQSYGHFHDACLTQLCYTSGTYVNEEMAMWFGNPEDSQLSMVFQRQGQPKGIELLFSGMLRMDIAGWQRYYTCDIFNCYLSFHRNLVAGQDDALIVWADNAAFDPKAFVERRILNEPMLSYVIAHTLKWRFV